MIAAFSFKSTHLNEDGIRLSDGTVIAKDEAHMAGMIDNRHVFLSSCMIVIAVMDGSLTISVVIIPLSKIIFNLGVGEIFDRVVVEIIQKMKDMKMVSISSIKKCS